MQDNDNGPTAVDATSQPPVRRRRAASRPAGPPPEVKPPAETPTTAAAQPDPTAATPVVDEAPTAPPRSRRATRAAAPATATQDVDAGARETAPEPPSSATSEAAAPTRTRRAPAKTRSRADAAAETPTPNGDTTPVPGTPDEQDAAPEKPKRTRRAPRATAATEDTAVSETVEPAASPAAAPEDKPATRRRRATRPAAPADSDDTQQAPAADAFDDVSAALDALTAQIASSAPTEPTESTQAESPTAEEPAKAPSRRRRASRPTAPPAPVETADDDTEPPEMDGITAALKMAEDAAKSRRAIVADPFRVPTVSRQARLDSLARSIASGSEDQDDDADEVDEDADEVDEDVVDTEEVADEDADTDDVEEAGADEESDEDSDDDSNDADDERSRGRRRRRGGRRRRRGGSNRGESDGGDAEADDGDDSDGEPEDGKPSDGHDSEDDDTDNGDSSDGGTTRRRRRRRRSGSDSPDSARGTGEDAITGIEGSTRMEAKRQRRRENRAAGRRRAPILSEAEFLARREAVDRKLVIRQGQDYTQLAVVEDGILVEHYVDRASATSLIGNVYLARVQNVLPSMEAAFLDIGRGRNAVLYAGEVDWTGFHVSAEDRKVEKVFKSGQTVLVQVTKDPVGAKGARLTGHISLPGRYVVYSPGGHLSGISRKLPDSERSRLREILGELIGDSESVIVRTAAEGASAEELVRDVNRLKAQWEIIEKKAKQGSAPAALYSEPDLTLRIVRDLFTEDFGALVVQGDGGAKDAFDEISAYVAHVAPTLADRVQRYEPDEKGHDAFAEYRIDEQIAKALDRKVFLPSGGSLVIDRTEAMTVIDVNTGRFTGAGGNLEATVTSNNLEAAEEVVRQLRLRDIGGIIVVDFIDMVLPSNRDLLLRRLVECLSRDRTRHQVAEVTSLGLVQLTRKKIGTGLAEAFTEECEHCHGDGYHRFQEPVDSQAPSDGGDRSGHGGGSHNGGGNRGRGGRGRRGGNGQSSGEKKSE